MKRLLFFTGLVLVLFFACTSNDEGEYTDNYYDLKAKELAESNGLIYEHASPKPLTKAEYEDLERLVEKINEHRVDSIILDLVGIEEDGTFIFSNASLKKNVKTRSESMSAKYKGITFTVSFSPKKSGGYTIDYAAQSDVYDIQGVSKDKEEISQDKDIVSFNADIRVICKSGSIYLHMPFQIKGSFNTSAGMGVLSVKEK